MALAQAPAGPFAGKVVGISDGDPLTVLVDCQTVKVRLHGVDASESGGPQISPSAGSSQ